MFLDQVTVPAELFGELKVGTFFVLERDMVLCNGTIPNPTVRRKTSIGGWERVFLTHGVMCNSPSNGTLAPDDHVIVLH